MSDTINNELTTRLRNHITAQRDTIKQQLTELVAFPSVHGTEETAQACRDAATATVAMFADAGVELTQHNTIDGSIALSGTLPGSLPESDPNAKTVLLYSHYDVQPAGDIAAWTDDPWTLTERDGRWYGRGTADCKGNVVMHLAALRALREVNANQPMPTIKIIVEGSEERGSAGLNNLIATQPDLFQADVILIADVGNAEVGQPTLVTTLRGTADIDVRVDTLKQPVHSGMFGGAAPDALAALIRILDSLRDETGATSIDGLDCAQKWDGLEYDADTFRSDAGVLDGVSLTTDGTSNTVSDLTWARPAVIVTGIDCPPATNAVNAIPAIATAHINFRIPSGVDPQQAQDALVAHIEAHAPWNVKLTITRDELAYPFGTDTDGDVVKQVSAALEAAYGKSTANMGEGASIPLCATLLEAVPNADIALFGVEEPQCAIHSADESVDPHEIRDIAIAEAIFLGNFVKTVTPA